MLCLYLCEKTHKQFLTSQVEKGKGGKTTAQEVCVRDIGHIGYMQSKVSAF